MMHKLRRFRVVDSFRDRPPFTADELAVTLTEHTWCRCNGFRIAHLIFVNDSTGPDGAQEYAVFDERIRRQVESLTVSWMTADKLSKWIHDALTRKPDEWPCASSAEWMPNMNHAEGACHECA